MAHPMWMRVTDKWKTLDQLCHFLSGHNILFAREVAR